MHSSTSSSSDGRLKVALAVLVVALLAYFAVLETISRLALPAMSEGQRRQHEDHAKSSKLEGISKGGERDILIVGNSLLLDGVDRQALVTALRPTYNIVLHPIEGTTYLDWKYGLKHLVDGGTRPRVVVLCLSVRHLMSQGTNGEAFARNLMGMRDLPAVVREAELSTMQASEYFFANLSAWLGARTYVRNWLIQKWAPNAPELVGRLTVVDSAPFNAESIDANRAMARLKEIQGIVAGANAGFVWLVPPANNAADPAPLIVSQASSMGISALLPYRPAEVPADLYYDGFHLNDEGAELFTTRLIQSLPALLAAEERAGGS